MAVRDYWDERLPSNNKIIISPSVERNLIASNDNSDRVNRLKRRLSGVDIDVFQARYEERMRLQEILRQIFAETDYAGRMPEIQNLYGNGEDAEDYLSEFSAPFWKETGA